MKTHATIVLDAIRTYFKQYGTAPRDGRRLAQMTKLPVKMVSRAIRQLVDDGKIRCRPRKYETIELVEKVQALIHPRLHPRHKQLVDERGSDLAKRSAAAMCALEDKRNELIGKKKELEDRILLIDRTIALLGINALSVAMAEEEARDPKWAKKAKR